MNLIEKLKLTKTLAQARAEAAALTGDGPLVAMKRLKLVGTINATRVQLGGDAAPSKQVLVGEHGHEYTMLDKPTVLYRAVSPEEFEEIKRSGVIAGGLNTFNGGDKRREVFFGFAMSASLISQGEDIVRRGEYQTQQSPLNAEYGKVIARLNELRTEEAAAVTALGYTRFDEIPRVVARRDGKLAAIIEEKIRLESQRQNLEAKGRDEISGKIREARVADDARGYSSVVLQTKPISGGRVYSGKHSGFSEDEVGFDSGAVKLSDIDKVYFIKGKQVVREEAAPTSAGSGTAPGADHIATLRDVAAGKYDSDSLSALYGRIATAVHALNDAGLLAGDAEEAANAAITRWAEIEERTDV